MIARAAIALAALSFASSAAATETAAASAVTAVSMDVSFGKVVPDGTVVQRPATVIVRSATPWTLMATNEGQANTLDTRRDVIELKTPAGEWMRLIEGIPVRVASGDVTTDAGALTYAEVRLSPSIESAPGMRRCSLKFNIGGPQTATSIPLSYEVQSWTRLDADPRPFQSPAINPARPGLYPYDRRHYIVRSNVEWAVDLKVSELKARSTSAQLPPNTLVVLGAGGSATPLVPDEALVIARGGPTGAEGSPIDIQLAIKVDEASMAGGEYAADLSVVIRPAAEIAPATAQKDQTR